MLPLLIVSALAFFFSWNNYSLLIGGLTASGSADYKRALLLTAAAIILGVLAEGWKVTPAAISGEAYEPALMTAILVFGASSIFNIPASISSVLVLSLSGSSLAQGAPLNTQFLYLVIISWIFSPLIAMVLVQVIYRAALTILRSSGLLAVDMFNRFSAYAVTFYAAYTLAANNIGFMINMISGGRVVVLSIVLAASLTGAFFTRRAYLAVGHGFVSLSPQRYFTSVFSSSIILWVMTQLGIPASLMQILIGAFMGAIYSSAIAVYNVRRLRVMLLSWIATAALSLPAGYIAALLLA